jgi:DNA end-binding protein Ku
MDGTLMLETLYYPDEIRVERGGEVPDVKVTKQELAMASSLIDLLTEEFKPEEYQDTYREALMKLIDAKLEGQEVVEAETPEPTKVVDLMAALKASVEATRRQKSQGQRHDEDEDEEAEPARASSRRRKAAS